MAVNIFQGDTFKGVISLRTIDVVDPTKTNTYIIPTGATIQINFPGITASVVLSTANAGEITIINASTGTLSYTGSPLKSVLLNPGKNQSLDLIVTDTAGNVTTFEQPKIINVYARANP